MPPPRIGSHDITEDPHRRGFQFWFQHPQARSQFRFMHANDSLSLRPFIEGIKRLGQTKSPFDERYISDDAGQTMRYFLAFRRTLEAAYRELSIDFGTFTGNRIFEHRFAELTYDRVDRLRFGYRFGIDPDKSADGFYQQYAFHIGFDGRPLGNTFLKLQNSWHTLLGVELPEAQTQVPWTHFVFDVGTELGWQETLTAHKSALKVRAFGALKANVGNKAQSGQFWAGFKSGYRRFTLETSVGGVVRSQSDYLAMAYHDKPHLEGLLKVGLGLFKKQGSSYPAELYFAYQINADAQHQRGIPPLTVLEGELDDIGYIMLVVGF